MRRVSVFCAVSAALLLPAACHRGPGELSADHAWVRMAAVPGNPAAGYLTIHGGAEPARLVSVDSDQAGSSELHQSMKNGSMASMQRLDGIDVPAAGTLGFAPGGNHVMLFGVNPQIKPGGTMTLTLRFAKGQPLMLKARVVGAGDAAPY